MDENHAWSEGTIQVLDNIRRNCIRLAAHHKRRYYKYRGYAKYFKLPLIVLSGINSVASVGLQTYLDQTFISGLTCVISLLCAVITSVELYLGIQKTMENELLSSKEFYLLGIDIHKIQTLEPACRLVNPRAYLDDKYKTYCKLVENSDLLHSRITDELASIPPTPFDNTHGPLNLSLPSSPTHTSTSSDLAAADSSSI
jgi:hypothetical protein